MTKEQIVFRDLTDEELLNMTDDELFEIRQSYIENGVPVRATVRGLLEELNIKYDDLTEFTQNMEVGMCNTAKRTDEQIYISRKDSSLKDNIVINLNDALDVPDITVQIQIGDDFIHEEAYNNDGLLIYRA